MGIQIQSATKYINGEGKLTSLPLLNRQFISFSYGGKNIEDFDLLASFSSDRLVKEIYAPFKDITTSQAELDGQMFWRSNFEAGNLSFDLVTDGLTSAQLEDFKEWFQPGFEKELILSEYHNRGIMARVASVPQMSLLPFEKEVKVTLGETRIITERDKEGVQIQKEELIYYPTKTSLYKGEIKLEFVMDDPYWYSLKDAVEDTEEESLKIIYEDGVPHKRMLQIPCFLSNKKYFNGSQIEQDKIELNDTQTDLYLYYCGTAPSKPIISFDTKLNFLEDNILAFNNDSTEAIISFGAEESSYKELKFTLPSLFISYNNAIKITKDYINSGGKDIVKLRALLRDSLYNYYTRSFVIGIIDNLWNKDENSVEKISGNITSSFYNNFLVKMKDFYSSNDSLHCEIDNKTGQVIIEVKVANTQGNSIIENAGNMIKSNYLTIDTRKTSKKGKITSADCLLVKANFILSNLQIDYKYMYL